MFYFSDASVVNAWFFMKKLIPAEENAVFGRFITQFCCKSNRIKACTRPDIRHAKRGHLMEYHETYRYVAQLRMLIYTLNIVLEIILHN